MISDVAGKTGVARRRWLSKQTGAKTRLKAAIVDSWQFELE
jgi:hypothetical protein